MRASTPPAAPERPRWRGWWLVLACVAAIYLIVWVPLPFVASWWGTEPEGMISLNARNRIAYGMVYAGALEGLTRGEVVAKLGQPEPSEYNAPGEDLVYVLGPARGWYFLEFLVLRLDQQGQVADAWIERD